LRQAATLGAGLSGLTAAPRGQAINGAHDNVPIKLCSKTDAMATESGSTPTPTVTPIPTAGEAQPGDAAASLLARFRVDGRVAVITGGARGIGLATARALVEAGARVVLLDRDGDEAAAAAEGLNQVLSQGLNKGLHEAIRRTPEGPAMADAMALDVADADAVERVFDAVAQRHGRIDILVNNAGVSIRKPSLELSLAEWQQVLAVNLTGVFLCARAAVARMPATGGAIVNTASIMGLSGGGPYANPAYHATKGALVNLTRAHAVEWAPRGVRVNAVAPTWTETGFIRALDATVRQRLCALMPLGRMAEPEEVATTILFLASPAASMVTGHILAVDGGYLAQ
jgi:NAD(P)-dependent dehydrogenase (short-subunit alcohol dehydrogenase family)